MIIKWIEYSGALGLPGTKGFYKDTDGINNYPYWIVDSTGSGNCMSQNTLDMLIEGILSGNNGIIEVLETTEPKSTQSDMITLAAVLTNAQAAIDYVNKN